jgi:diguanylate cyclase
MPPVQLMVVGAMAIYLVANEAVHLTSTVAKPWMVVLLPNLITLLSSLVCLRRSQLDAAPGGWRLLSGALALRGLAGLLAGAASVGWIPDPPFPIVDGLSLAFYPLAGLAIAHFIRTPDGDESSGRWADALVCGIGALALIAFLALDPASARMRGANISLVLPLAYPVCDVFLLVLVIVGLSTWRNSRAGAYLVAAVGFVSVGDTVRLLSATAQHEAFGNRVTYLWLICASLIGMMAAERPAHGPRRSVATASLGAALTFAMTSVGLLILDRFRAVHPVALVLGGCALAAAGVRSGLAFRELRTLTQSRREARTDELTQLPNRRSFSEMIARAVERAQTDNSALAVLMVDLDGFKVINDTLGHHTGDELLREVARRFSATLAPGDMLARLGGDEFGIVVHPRDEAGWALAAGARLVQSLETRMELDGVLIQVRASVGAALYPDHGDSQSPLLQRADVAMYEAKRSGSGVRFYSQSFDRNSREQLEHLEELRKAIDLNQLTLYYQPKVRFVDGALTGVEALVRWNHPTRGLLPPDEFLPLALEGGLLPQLTRRVLSLAVQQAGLWHLEDESLGVAVNVGSADLADHRFPTYVEEVLARHKLPAGLLTIEITEDSVIKDPVRTAEVVARLRKMGINVSIDDFGAGYASLSLLRELDLDELKLDKSLVEKVDSSNRQKALVRAAVDLAHALGLRLVAEGVETAEAWRDLQLLDCDVAQGYLVSRPLTPIDLRIWMNEQRRRRNPAVSPSAQLIPAIRRRQRTLPPQAWASVSGSLLPAPLPPAQVASSAGS